MRSQSAPKALWRGLRRSGRSPERFESEEVAALVVRPDGARTSAALNGTVVEEAPAALASLPQRAQVPLPQSRAEAPLPPQPRPEASPLPALQRPLVRRDVAGTKIPCPVAGTKIAAVSRVLARRFSLAYLCLHVTIPGIRVLRVRLLPHRRHSN
ncbi:MAG: hypothetical protein MHM6MM_007901 [Cercozoa sp. M6MM]